MINDDLNEEFSNLLGKKHNWTNLIDSNVRRISCSFGAEFDDTLADVSANLLLDLRHGKLAEKISISANILATIAVAVQFRAMDVRKKNKTKNVEIQFSQLEKNSGWTLLYQDTVAEKPGAVADFDTPDYVLLIINELEKMSQETEKEKGVAWRAKSRRQRQAKEIVPDRAAGARLTSLMKKFSVQKTTMFEILQEIKVALVNVSDGQPELKQVFLDRAKRAKVTA